MLRVCTVLRALTPALKKTGAPFTSLSTVPSERKAASERVDDPLCGKLLSFKSWPLISKNGTRYSMTYYTVMLPCGSAVEYRSFRNFACNEGKFVRFRTKNGLVDSMQAWNATKNDIRQFPAHPLQIRGASRNRLQTLKGTLLSHEIHDLPHQLSSEDHVPTAFAHWYTVRADDGTECTAWYRSSTQSTPLMGEGARVSLSVKRDGSDTAFSLHGFEILPMTISGRISKNRSSWCRVATSEGDEHIFMNRTGTELVDGGSYRATLLPLTGLFYRVNDASLEG
ncbi:hypothetical protein DIPPA_57915 [Diplonema papillatum]|nr:hypothetical protein DIPPA_57915 [Diplonema papillatum]